MQISRAKATPARSGLLAQSERLACVAVLAAGPADAFDPFARIVAKVLDAPIALISLVHTDHQTFLGMVGLPEPWATTRSSPVDYSFCQHVVTHGLRSYGDARTDVQVRDSPAVGEIGILAYAGVALHDRAGHVLGAVCAIDTMPRMWSRLDMAGLADVAVACSAEVALRLRGGC
ncbi:GAF domain-containing protein [Allocatelliglobosispora scoriae]|uniref:GAF domain-containing protein n=1 Tax=Allocatelliglobosispora scoriae TaxID=643052 RepID=A0A841BIW1_9ACTN|nr:GAF domain-containing protein [Allocatelliglobosispora scoriae]MBB5866841.1 GAF domain-containing protein [Allocatelliglobosispora scoriae]